MSDKFDKTYLQCIECGHTTSLLLERKFICPYCSNLYDVVHDFDLYGLYEWEYYTDLFDGRAEHSYFHDSSPIYTSGVWRFHEWIMPCIPVDEIITLHEGNVPIIKAGEHLQKWTGSRNLHIILEGMTPTGSFKDFGGTVMTTVAKAVGINAIGCASTGDTSAMAAAYASVAGMQCVVVLPKGKVTSAQIAQPLVHGAAIIMLPGTFDDCMRVVRELVEMEKLFPANSLNPTRIEGHQATVFLTAQYFGWQLPDWFVLPVGNGSNCSSIGKGMRLMHQFGYVGNKARILGSQSEAAHPLSLSWLNAHAHPKDFNSATWHKRYFPQRKVGETTATAALIGNPVSYKKVIREIIASDGVMNTVPEKLLNEAVGVCGRDGHFVCPQTGTALAGVKLAIESGEMDADARVVVVSTANGLKFTESATTGLEDQIIEANDCNTSTIEQIMGL